jgi:peptidoglycan/LPS O-acetylase OafA/YrhL
MYSNRYIYLEFIRGFSALLVFLGHARAIMFSDFSKNNTNLFSNFFYFITGFGHQSVIVFFVISGFFIAKSIDNSIELNGFSFKNYFINRISRLYIVLIPALVIGAIFDVSGLKIFGNSYGNIPNMPGVSPLNQLKFEFFIGNISFLQNILVPTFGSNSALWSLTNEFWYYMFYPFLLNILIAKKFIKINKILSIAILGVLLILIFNNILIYFPIWLMGVCAYYLLKIKFSFFNLFIFEIVIPLSFLTILGISRFNSINGLLSDYLIGIIFSCMVILSVNSNFNLFSNSIIRIVKYFSSISFTLYLFHLPIVLILCYSFGLFQVQFNIMSFFYYCSVIIFSFGLCSLFWWIFERRTSEFKKFMVRILNF